MRFTLLDIVQQILSALDSEEVNSISDSTEAYQVAVIARSVFYDIATDLNLPEHQGLFELDASVIVDRPTIMTLPTTVTRMDSVKYDNKMTGDSYSNHVDVEYMEWNDFYAMQNALSGNTSGVGQMFILFNGEYFPMMYRNDRHPRYWTTMDDRQIIFDAYDSSLETTLQKSKTVCQGALYPVFSMDDNSYPQIDPTQFSYYINKCKTRAFAELKQAANPESSAETRRQKVILQKRMRRTQGVVPGEIARTPRFGRK